MDTNTTQNNDAPPIKARLSVGFRSTELTIFQNDTLIWRGEFQFWAVDWIYRIVEYMRTQHNLLIGLATADRILIEMGSLIPLEQEKATHVKGRNLVTGMPTAVEISTIEIRGVLEGVNLSHLTWHLSRSLEAPIPPDDGIHYPPVVPLELRQALRSQPIELTGDFGRVRGLDEQIKAATGLNVIATDTK